MERYIGLDAHATSCTFAVLSERGRRLDSAVVETNGRALESWWSMKRGRRRLSTRSGKRTFVGPQKRSLHFGVSSQISHPMSREASHEIRRTETR